MQDCCESCSVKSLGFRGIRNNDVWLQRQNCSKLLIHLYRNRIKTVIIFSKFETTGTEEKCVPKRQTLAYFMTKSSEKSLWQLNKKPFLRGITQAYISGIAFKKRKKDSQKVFFYQTSVHIDKRSVCLKPCSVQHAAFFRRRAERHQVAKRHWSIINGWEN